VKFRSDSGERRRLSRAVFRRGIAGLTAVALLLHPTIGFGSAVTAVGSALSGETVAVQAGGDLTLVIGAEPEARWR